MAPPPTAFARRALGSIVLGVVAFTVYGSLVPFEFRSRTLGEAADSFLWAMTSRVRIESRSDALANVLLGIPLGFGLLGRLRLGSTNRLGDLAVGALLLPGCMAFAASVEFAQLFVPERTCCASDVLCQGFGAVLGMTVWIVAGRRLMHHAEEVWNGADSAGRLLMVYLVLLAFIQLLPMDLSPSPRDLYRKIRDQVVFLPFSEFQGRNGDKTWERATRLIQVFGLYVPIGLLAARARLRPAAWLVPLAIGVAFGMEALQLIVHSRIPSATDVVVGAAGALAGWFVVPLAVSRLALAAVWLLGLVLISWQPFVQAPNPPLCFDWIPGLPLESGNPLFALEEMLTKFVLFGLLGVLVDPGKWHAVSRATVAGLLFSGLFEAGQTVFVSHWPCVTDVLLGGMGAAIGCRLRMSVTASRVSDRVSERRKRRTFAGTAVDA